MATARYLQRGLGIKSLGMKVNNFLRRTKAISRAASQFGHPNVSRVASALGYGRRRYRRRRHQSRVGQGLKLAGQGLSMAGGARHRVSRYGMVHRMASLRPLPMMY